MKRWEDGQGTDAPQGERIKAERGHWACLEANVYRRILLADPAALPHPVTAAA